MNPQVAELFGSQGGVATSAQILNLTTRHAFEKAIHTGVVERIWQGIYCLGEPTDAVRLRGLDLSTGRKVAVCLGTAAAVHGFDTESRPELHVLSPPGVQLRTVDGLVVHRRDGAPLTFVDGRYATAPASTAIEVARSLRRPRALATLDAALRSGTCNRAELWRAAFEQAGRRGIVHVRNLIALADGRAESPMESWARLVMLDGGLPAPELQYQVIDGNGERRRLDFAWPHALVAVEYDSEDWHGNPDAVRNDRRRTEALNAVGWTVVAIMAEDVRRRQGELIERIGEQLRRDRAACRAADTHARAG
jgi:hypothetical protein